MFRAILATQWKWSRGLLLALTCTAFALPFLSLRAAAAPLAQLDAGMLLSIMESFGAFYAVAAATIGLMIAMIAWSADHSGRHVYALSLPIARWKYVAMRFGAGALTIAPPVIALWIGASVALMVTSIPTGLTTHPLALAIRFALAALVAYAVFFAISSGTRRTAGIILGVVLGALAVQVVGELFGLRMAAATALFDMLTNWSGMLGVFNGRWMLIDV